MATDGNIPINPEKSSLKYNCIICDYHTSSKKDMAKHLLTPKHINTYQKTEIMLQSAIKSYNCKCGKEYKHSQSLYNHKKLCTYKETELKENEKEEEQTLVIYEGSQMPANNALILQVIKDNKDMMTEIMGLVAKTLAVTSSITNNNTMINNNNTTNNKQFNLNVYLNETCKDAMNMEDFIKEIKITNKDIDDMGALGFSQSVANIIVREIGKVDETKRPFHCLDKKREMFCIKEKGEWIKDTSENKLMKGLVAKIAQNEFRYMLEWKKANPGWDNPLNKKHDDYIKITKNLMDCLIPEVDADNLNIERTIRNVIKYCLITK